MSALLFLAALCAAAVAVAVARHAHRDYVARVQPPPDPASLADTTRLPAVRPSSTLQLPAFRLPGPIQLPTRLPRGRHRTIGGVRLLTVDELGAELRARGALR